MLSGCPVNTVISQCRYKCSLVSSVVVRMPRTGLEILYIQAYSGEFCSTAKTEKSAMIVINVKWLSS